jgi:hypothetical protein
MGSMYIHNNSLTVIGDEISFSNKKNLLMVNGLIPEIEIRDFMGDNFPNFKRFMHGQTILGDKNLNMAMYFVHDVITYLKRWGIRPT